MAVAVGGAILVAGTMFRVGAVGIIVALVLLVWLARRPWRRSFTRRHILAAALVAGIPIAWLYVAPAMLRTPQMADAAKMPGVAGAKRALETGAMLGSLVLAEPAAAGIAWGITLLIYGLGLQRTIYIRPAGAGRSWRVPNPAIRGQFATLAALVDALFPDAWTGNGAAAIDAVAGWLGAHPDAAPALAADCDRFLAMPMSDEAAEDILLTDLASGFDPAFAGWSAKDWIGRVRDLVAPVAR